MALYLVTGGCGFIGSHLCDALAGAGHQVRILDDLSTGRRANAPAATEFRQGDVGDAAAVDAAMAGVDGCFHLAAIASVARSNEDWRGTHRANLTGAVNVFEAARRARGGAPVPVVYASSAAVYGDNPAVPLAETAATRPLTAYGADKLGCELHARVAGLVHGVPTVGLRFFNVYGPRQDPRSPYSGVISIFAARILRGEPVDVHGDGEQVRDFVYVADVVRFLVAAMAGATVEPRVYNVCTGRQTSVNALAALLGAAAGRPPVLRHGPPRAGDIRVSLGDPSAAAAGLGLTAGTLVRDGLARTLDSLAEG
ncbi:MAG: NAD-dependent epimerase/dehydratase family protein [Rhodospirillales bacterium]